MVQVAKDATDLLLWVELVDENNDYISNVAYDNSDLVFKKLSVGDSSFQTVTLVEGTVGTYLENSWVEISGGLYQFCPPNSWIVENQATLVQVEYPGVRDQRDLIEATAGGSSGDTIITNPIDTSATIFDSTSMEINLTRGDDYLVANESQIEIPVSEDVGDISASSSTAFFKAKKESSSDVVQGTASVIQKSGAFYIRLVFTRVQTAAGAAGSYNWDAEIQDDNGYVRTRVVGRLNLSESWTDIIT